MPPPSQGTRRPLHRSELLSRLVDRGNEVWEVVPDEPMLPEFEVVPDEPEPNLRDLPEWEPGAVLEF